MEDPDDRAPPATLLDYVPAPAPAPATVPAPGPAAAATTPPLRDAAWSLPRELFAATLDTSVRPSPAPDSAGRAAFDWSGTQALSPPPAQSPEANVTPETPGRYEVRKVFGSGGMSIVYLVWDEHVGREIALKVLRPELSGEGGQRSSAQERFLREARITGQLEHPGIVPVHEVGRRADGSDYYTLKLIRGRGFDEAIAAARGLDGRLKLLPHFVDICQAMAYAHGRGVVHRDLKPGNVMVGAFGETVVLDWGLAKMRGQPDLRGGDVEASAQRLDAPPSGLRPSPTEPAPPSRAAPSADATRDGAVFGTPQYMSPEQARGELKLVDERSDVFSLGAILYELLAGRPPFAGQDIDAVIDEAATREAPRVATFEPRAPPELCAVAERACARSRDRRYATAAELAADVEAWMSGANVRAYEYSSLELAKKFVARNRTASAVGLAAFVLLAIAAVWIQVDARAASRNLALARHSLAFALMEKAGAAQREGRWARAAAHFAGARVQEDSPQASYGAALALAHASRPVARLAPDPATAEPLYAALFLPDQRAVTAGDDGLLRVWDAAGAPLGQVDAGQEAVIALALAGPRLLSAGMDGSLALWDASALHEGAAPLWRAPAAGAEIAALAAAPDGSRAATADDDGAVRIFTLGEPGAVPGAPVVACRHAGGAAAVAFSRDGRLLASGGADGIARVTDVASGRVLRELQVGAGNVSAVALSPDASALATGSADGTAQLWDLASGSRRLALPGHERILESLAFSPDGGRIASASWDGTSIIWDAASGRVLERLDAHALSVTSAAFSASGDRLITSSVDRTALVWALPEGDVRLAGHQSTVRALAFSPDGKRLASGAEDKRLLLWDSHTGALLETLALGAGWVRALAFSPDGARLASAGEDGSVRVLDVSGPAAVQLLRLQAKQRVDGVAWAPGGKRLASCGDDGKLHVWDVAEEPALAGASPAAGIGRELAALEHGGRVESCAYSPDGRWLASGSTDTTIRLWDAATLAPVALLRGHQGTARSLAFSPDGQLLASGGGDDLILLWQLPSGRLAGRLSGHEALVRGLAFLPGAPVFVSGSADRTVRLWDAASRSELARIAERGREVFAVAVSPDGLTVAAGGRDHFIDLTALPSPEGLPPPAELLASVLDRYGYALEGVHLEHRFGVARPTAPQPGRKWGQKQQRASHRE